MFKRIFWLALAVLAGWIAWRWLQQREAAFDSAAAPHLPFEPLPPIAAAPTMPAEPPAVAPSEQAAMPAAQDEEAVKDAPAAQDEEAVKDAPAAQDEEAVTDAPAAQDEEVAQDEEAVKDAPAEDAKADDAMPAQAAVEAAAPDDALGDVVGYCVRCKTKRTISDAHEDITESGRRAARGVCPVCGAKMFTFLPTD